MKVVDGCLEWCGSDRRIAVSRIVVTQLVALLCVAVAGVAGAEEAGPNYARDGMYMGARGIYGVSFFAREDVEVEDRLGGFGIHVGYRTREFLAGEFDFEVMDPGWRETVGGETFVVRNVGLTLYAKVYPLSFLRRHNNWLDRFQPYVKAGPGLVYFYGKDELVTADRPPEDRDKPPKDTGVGFAARFGAGTEFYLSNRIALTFDATYVVTAGNTPGRNYLALGLIGFQWRFSAE